MVFDAFPNEFGIGLLGAIAEKPFRVVALTVEKESVTDDTLVVLCGEVHEAVDGFESVGAFLGAHLLPFHTVLRRDAIEVSGEYIDFLWGVDFLEIGSNCGSNEKLALRQLAQ